MVISKQVAAFEPATGKVSKMTIPKAIEILRLAISDPDLVGAIDLLDAQKLAVDALIFLEDSHTAGCLFKTSTPT